MRRVSLLLISLSLTPFTLSAEIMRADKTHQQVWNEFAQYALTLHRDQIDDVKHIKKQKTGGYSHLPRFYIENTYYAADNPEQLLSRVTWEREKPNNLHTVEVFIHDAKDRVIRDYTAAYLPSYRSAPSQTLLTLHVYNKGLHGMRTFDASSTHILDKCVGKYRGKEVFILLDEDELYEADGDEDGILYSKVYKTCFKGMPTKPGKHLP